MTVDVGVAQKFEIEKRNTSFPGMKIAVQYRGRDIILVGHLVFCFGGRKDDSMNGLVHVLDLILLEWSVYEIPDEVIPTSRCKKFLLDDAVWFVEAYSRQERGEDCLVYDLVSKELEVAPIQEHDFKGEFKACMNGGFLEDLNELVVFFGWDYLQYGERNATKTRRTMAFNVGTRSWREPVMKGNGPVGVFTSEGATVSGKRKLCLLVCGRGLARNRFYVLTCTSMEYHWSSLKWSNPWFFSRIRMKFLGSRIIVFGSGKTASHEVCAWDVNTDERLTIGSGLGTSVYDGQIPRFSGTEIIYCQQKLFLLDNRFEAVNIVSGVE